MANPGVDPVVLFMATKYRLSADVRVRVDSVNTVFYCINNGHMDGGSICRVGWCEGRISSRVWSRFWRDDNKKISRVRGGSVYMKVAVKMLVPKRVGPKRFCLINGNVQVGARI